MLLNRETNTHLHTRRKSLQRHCCCSHASSGIVTKEIVSLVPVAQLESSRYSASITSTSPSHLHPAAYPLPDHLLSTSQPSFCLASLLRKTTNVIWRCHVLAIAFRSSKRSSIDLLLLAWWSHGQTDRISFVLVAYRRERMSRFALLVDATDGS